ncbi:hypothetical protein OG432_34750 [Streptomyces sp. NBC_00442]|uniref:hypothetical protein n=1 Tax=Streptomyces sp. NBC_00442 TaxID=2903651 RepID=UPI002E1C3E3F
MTSREDTHLFCGEITRTLMANIERWEEHSGDIFEELRKAIAGVADACANTAMRTIAGGKSDEATLAAVTA